MSFFLKLNQNGNKKIYKADYDFGADDICCICFEELAVTDAT
jgi:hypothetical protein